MSKTDTTVRHIVQGSVAFGPEWGRWEDMPGKGYDSAYDAIGKAEMFHYFMEHGHHPEPFASLPQVKADLPGMQLVRNVLVAAQGERKFKFRTRVVRRTTVITDEEIDKAMIVKHGEQT